MGVLTWTRTRMRSMLTDGLVYFVALTGTPSPSLPEPRARPRPAAVHPLTPVPVDRREHLQPDPLPPAERSDTGPSAPTLCHDHGMVADPPVCCVSLPALFARTVVRVRVPVPFPPGPRIVVLTCAWSLCVCFSACVCLAAFGFGLGLGLACVFNFGWRWRLRLQRLARVCAHLDHEPAHPHPPPRYAPLSPPLPP